MGAMIGTKAQTDKFIIWRVATTRPHFYERERDEHR